MPQKAPILVVSEPDLQAALEHLRALPYRPDMPFSWDRQRLVEIIRQAVGKKTKVGNWHEVAPGVFVIIKPFGVDLAGVSEFDERLQVWIAIREAYTDPGRLITL